MPGIKPIILKEILRVLRAELALQTRHCKLLEAQQLALLACDRPRFTVLQDEYAQIVVLLEAQTSARKAALSDEDGEALTLSMIKAMVLPKDLPKLNALEDGLQQVLEQVQTLSRRNQTLIQNELDYFAFSLDLFVEAGRSADIGYGSRQGLHGARGRHTSLWMLDHRA